MARSSPRPSPATQAPTDWRLAAYHYAAACGLRGPRAVVQAAVPTIMGGGEFALAESYVQHVGPDEQRRAFELFTVADGASSGHAASALAHAEIAVDLTHAVLTIRELHRLRTRQLGKCTSFQSGQLKWPREVAETLRGTHGLGHYSKPICGGD